MREGETAQEKGALEIQDVMQLLRSVANQLKLPLTTIARQAELGQLTGEPALVDLAAVRTHATAAMKLVDCYLLGLQLLREQASLELEPVSVSSLLAEAAHELDGFARQYGTKLELHIAGKYEPVMTHRSGLKSALLTLGYALLEDYPVQQGQMTLAVHRTPHGIVAGLYGDYQQLSAAQWRKALELQGKAPQPLSALCSGSGAGLFVADTILRAMATRLRVGIHQRQRGFVATLQPSQQLRFV
jgi:hypothetical protein